MSCWGGWSRERPSRPSASAAPAASPGPELAPFRSRCPGSTPGPSKRPARCIPRSATWWGRSCTT
eukprot:3600550-Rhodomonas_salina.1